MSQLPPDSKRLRRLFIAALAGFVVGMVGFLIFIGWVMQRFADPGTPWYQLLHVAVNGLVISVLVGLAVAVAAMWLVDLFSPNQGVRRCMRCGRSLRGLQERCNCADAEPQLAQTSQRDARE